MSLFGHSRLGFTALNSLLTHFGIKSPVTIVRTCAVRAFWGFKEAERDNMSILIENDLWPFADMLRLAYNSGLLLLIIRLILSRQLASLAFAVWLVALWWITRL